MRNRNLAVRRNVRNNKRALVESIMAKIRPILESAVNESEPNLKGYAVNGIDRDGELVEYPDTIWATDESEALAKAVENDPNVDWDEAFEVFDHI